MARCKITEVGASTLANALRLNPSYMRELDLSYNPVEGTGFDQLNSLVEDPGIRLEKLTVEGLGENHCIERLRQDEVSLTLDPNTASVGVEVSEGGKEAWYCNYQKQPPLDNPERFKSSSLVMCREGLTRRHFCQVEWFGRGATIGMAYKDISRKGSFAACNPGYNKKSWAITVSTPYPLSEALHDGVKTRLPDQSAWRVGVYLDWPAGTLSFYDITYDKADLIHTFYVKFTKPLYMIFSISAEIYNPNSKKVGTLHKIEDSLDERTNSLRSLLKERLKKKYHDIHSTDYVPMKLHLLTRKDDGIKIKQMTEGLKGLIQDFFKAENVIEYDDLFKPCPTTNKDVRTVLMKGNPGIGKTSAVKKFVSDWMEGRAHQDITFVLPFSLTELSSVNRNCSLMQLLGLFYPELTDTDALLRTKVLFVLDDLSKCRLKLNFWHTKPCSDPVKELSLSALLRVVEIQGLDDVQWEEYVRRLVRDCSITATVLEELMTNTCTMELPLTLTEIYTHYLLIQIRGKAFQEQAEAKRMKTDAEEILKLGNLAWQTLEKGCLTIFETDLTESKIAPAAAAELAQRWTTFFTEDELIQGKAYHFAHHSVQAYLAALYVAANYEPSKGNVLSYVLEEGAEGLLQPEEPPCDMYQRAIDKALKTQNGQLDFFLIFLIGISVGPSYEYLSSLLPDSCQRGSSENIVPYIFKNFKKSPSLILFCCLDELNVSYTDCQGNVQEEFTPSEWSSKAKALLNSEDQQKMFDIREYQDPDVAFLRLLPVIKSSKVLRSSPVPSGWMVNVGGQPFSGEPSAQSEVQSTHTQRISLYLAAFIFPSIATSRPAPAAEKHPHSMMLPPPCFTVGIVLGRLASCSVGHEELLALVSALSSNPSHLRELDLSYCRPGPHAFRRFCSLLKNPRFQLEILILVHTEWWEDVGPSHTSSVRQSLADIIGDACNALASALSSSNLRVLDLSINCLKDTSVEQLSVGLMQPACKLESLRMARCEITEVGASTLANALRLNPSHMRELDLSYNSVEGTGLDQLNSLVEDPAIRLEKLTVEGLGENHCIERLRQDEFSLTLDPNTASVGVEVSEGGKEAWYCNYQKQPPLDNPERFKSSSLVMCREGLTRRHFCQVEWFGRGATIGMAYKDISRKGSFAACNPGYNKKSWAITVSTPYPLSEALHDGVKTRLPDQSAWRVGVYLDWPAGTLSFYDITYDKAKLIHTFYVKFTKPLYMIFSISAGIRLLPPNPDPVCCHDHDPWDMLRGFKDCKGCHGSKAC
ncbi:hypothetical protein NFI96_002518 [Prochilodus magdalenae]|nr:hypothetical protein NFI96_002518 [Prochilodus magdalenae]